MLVYILIHVHAHVLQTKLLMPMGSTDLVEVVKRSLLQYSREFSELELLMFPEVNAQKPD